MSSIECPNPVYYKIVNNLELYSKVLEKKEILSRLLLYRSLYDEKGDTEKIFEKAEKIYFDKKRKISEKSETAKKIIELNREFEKEGNWMPEEFEELLCKHPSFIGQVILGEEIFNYKKYGFSSKKSLEESLTSFCISEQHLLERDYNEDIWRTKNMKNKISLNMHGDLYASQCDVSGKSRIEKTLFEEVEIFDTIKKFDYGDYGSISAYQDWSQFLVSLLKYAEYLGKKDIPEIVNWKNVLGKAGGGVGTSTSEAMFGSGVRDVEIERLMESPVLSEKIKKLERFPLSIHSQGPSSLCYIENNNLFYLRENENGDVSLEKFSHIYKDKNFSKCLEYCEEDLVPALTATYKYFARDRSLLPKIMNYFNNEKMGFMLSNPR